MWTVALQQASTPNALVSIGDVLVVRCGDNRLLGVQQVQAPGKRAVGARDFANGMLAKGGHLTWQPEKHD